MPSNINHSVLLTVQKIPESIAKINLERLTKQLIQQANTFPLKRKKQFLMGRSLLAELIFLRYQLPQLPKLSLTGNKPIFEDTQYGHFNISHSSDYIAVCLADSPIGLDIEQIIPRHNHLKIAHTCFSDKENQWITQQPSSLVAFLRLWTQRESILKLYGKGVWQMQQISLDPENSTFDTSFLRSIYNLTIQCDTCVISLSQYHRITLVTDNNTSLNGFSELIYSNSSRFSSTQR